MKSFQNFIDEGKKCPEGKYYCFTDKNVRRFQQDIELDMVDV